MEKLTRKQAFDLSIEKWEGIVKTGETPENIRNLGLKANCGLCEIYFISIKDICSKCPINIIKNKEQGLAGCRRTGHPFDKWAEDETTENAQAVLDLIKSKQ